MVRGIFSVCPVNQMNKPLVSYIRSYLPVECGEEALVTIIHPDGSTELRLTSPVLDLIPRINDGRPVFETLNSIYVPTDREKF
jgi:hypothetical protein